MDLENLLDNSPLQQEGVTSLENYIFLYQHRCHHVALLVGFLTLSDLVENSTMKDALNQAYRLVLTIQLISYYIPTFCPIISTH